MEKKWNEEVVRLAKDLHELKEAERNEGVRSMINILYKWVEEYFLENKYENSKILDYSIQPRNTIRVTFLSESLLINFDGFGERIIISYIKPNNQDGFDYYYSTETLKSENEEILSSKKIFEILDAFTKKALDNYSKNYVYI